MITTLLDPLLYCGPQVTLQNSLTSILSYPALGYSPKMLFSVLLKDFVESLTTEYTITSSAAIIFQKPTFKKYLLWSIQDIIIDHL